MLDFGIERKDGPCASCGGLGGGTLLLPGSNEPISLKCDACLAIEEAERVARVERELVEMRLARGGRDARLASWSLATYPRDAAGRAALDAAEAWAAGYANGERRNLYLHGPVGGGKTGLAWGIVRGLIELACVEAMLVNWRDALAELRQSYDDRRSGAPTDYVRMRSVPVLALDDVGAERPTDHAREELSVLVEHRYSRRLPVIVTSNYSPDKLGARLGHDDPVIGQRIVSRLLDGTVRFKVDAPDRRVP